MLLLAFSPFEDETKQNADNNVEFIHLVLGIFDKDIAK